MTAKTTAKLTQPVTAFSPAVCAAVQRRVLEALAPLAAELGLAVAQDGRGKYTEGHYTLPLGFSLQKDGVTRTREAETFLAVCHLYDLKPEDLGTTITLQGRTFTIAGMSSREKRMPILATSDGKDYWLTLKATLKALNRESWRTYE